MTYNVSFDYQAGSDGIYAAAVGVGEYNGNVQLKELPMSMGKEKDGHFTMQVTGDSTGQTWFGIYSTEKAPDLQGVSPDAAEANFGGYKELVLDNLVIELQKQKKSIKKSITDRKFGAASRTYLKKQKRFLTKRELHRMKSRKHTMN